MIPSVKENILHNANPKEVPILGLPPVVIQKIFNFLPLNNIGSCAKACQKFAKVSKQDALWKLFFHTHTPKSDSKSTHAHLDLLGFKYGDLVKNSEINRPNVRKEPPKGQSYPVKTSPNFPNPFAGNFWYKCEEGKVEVFNFVLNKGYQLDSEGALKEIIKGTPNRLLTENILKGENEARIFNLWNSESGECIATHKYAKEDVELRLQNENYYFTIGDKNLKALNLQTGEIKEFKENIDFKELFRFGCLKSAKNTLLFTDQALPRHVIDIFNIKTSKPHSLDHGNPIYYHEIINENYLVTRSAEPLVKIWDIDSGECLKSFVPKDKIAQNWHFMHGDYFFAACDNFIEIFNMKTNDLLILNQETDFPICPQVVGKHLLTEAWGTINIWDIETGECYRTFQTNESIRWMEMVGPFLFTANRKEEIKIYDTATGKCLHTIQVQVKEGFSEFFIRGNALIAKFSNVLEGAIYPSAKFIEIFRF